MEPNLVLITVASIAGGVGLSLLFVGMLMALLVALGNKHYIFGAFIFLCFPIAFIYGFLHKSAMKYAMGLLYLGLFLFLLFFSLLWFEMDRLGLSVIEVISSTKPKH